MVVDRSSADFRAGVDVAHPTVAFWTGGLKVSCAITDIMNVLIKERLGDEILMKFAGFTKLHGNKKAQAALANFLNGGKQDFKFDLRSLLNEDDGVKECTKRHFFRNSTVGPMTGVCTIRQREFRDEDWRNALGTYYIYYVDVGKMRLSFVPERVVLAWGFDWYQWNPQDSERLTQCLHQAAARLERKSSSTGADRIEVPVAKKFKMYTDPILLGTSSFTMSNKRTDVPSQALRGYEMFMRGVSAIAAQPMCRAEK